MGDIMSVLAKFITSTKYEDLTTQAVAAAKNSILDTIAVSIAGSASESCKPIVDLVKGWGGNEESTIWIYGGKVPAVHAGLAIGPMARALDLGNFHAKGRGHVTEYVLPAAFPIAERQGGVTGRDFITAVALGDDLVSRFHMSHIKPHGKNDGGHGAAGVFGPTTAVAKLLGLDEDATWNAMGIALSCATPEPMQGYKDGALTPRARHGFLADSAIKAALMAQRGITGAKNILQGEYSFYEVFSLEHDLGALTSELGKRFEGVNLSFKLYPSCSLMHGAIDGAIECVTEHDIEPQDVAEVDVGMGGAAYQFLCEPKEIKSNPRNIVDCQFSLPYNVATAIVKRSVFIEDFTDDAINRPDVREMARKVSGRVDEEVITPDNQVGGATVTIKTKDGREYSKRVLYAKGHPKNPMSLDDVIDKFRRCLPFSARPLPKEHGEEIARMVTNLEEVDDVARIAELLVP